MGNNLSDNVYHTFAGKVVRTSPYGFQMEQHVESERWLNYGKYFEGDKLETGDHGQEYTVNVQETPSGGYYIKQIQMGIKGEDTVKPKDIPPKNVINDKGSVVPKTSVVGDDRKQELIVRQNSISNACNLLQNKKDVSADEVLYMATQFENWVFRKEKNPTEEFLDDVPF